MSDNFRTFDFSGDTSFGANRDESLFQGQDFDQASEFDDATSIDFGDLEDRLLAAGELVEPRLADPQLSNGWTESPEEEMVAFADELPRPRRGLRSEFLAEVTAVERRREQLRKLPVIAACLLAASVGLLPSPEPPAPGALSGMASRNGELPIAAGIPEELLGQFVLADSRAAVEAAGRNDDTWALVDACDKLRTRQYLSLQESISSRRRK
jgi:hypothetical protein